MSIEQEERIDATEELLVERRGSVGLVTLNRPDRLNAVPAALGTTLREAFLNLEADPEIRAIVLTGAGRAFCAGADIKGGGSGDAESVLRDTWNPLVETMLDLEVPIIAAINGVAAGAGASLTFACDLRIAAPAARFQLSFVKIGLMPDVGATWLLPRIVGLGRANELAFLGRDLSAADALEWGLVSAVAEADVVDEAIALAERFAAVSSSVATIKRAHQRALASELPAHLVFEAAQQGRLQGQPDFAEAASAFAEKRAPTFARRIAPER